jgi:Fic family protein
MSNDRKTIYLRMLKRFGTPTTARNLVATEGMSYHQALKYLSTLVKPKPLTRAEEDRLIAFINNQ